MAGLVAAVSLKRKGGLGRNCLRATNLNAGITSMKRVRRAASHYTDNGSVPSAA